MMKTILFLLLLLPFISFAQEVKYEGDFYTIRLDSNSKMVSLPALHRSDFTKLYEVGRRSAYSYLVTSDTAYYKIFSRYHKDSLPVFDFSKQELLVRISCTQCLVFCKGNEPCHRNACGYKDFWFVRNKEASD